MWARELQGRGINFTKSFIVNMHKNLSKNLAKTSIDLSLTLVYNFTITARHEAKAWTSGDSRKINAYYVHAYKTLQTNVTAGLTADSKKGITSALNITLSRPSSAWQLACSVTYKF